eukprot:TRINITY_DN5859_c0_g1_i1.p1 TRINITY_DN5859_c0_g1~~TRINITY_DN5859_c0_g1_i1.p1  ORF type:complete len:498 (-),score=78.76 TRINITY_DN5859_c0_g1_i1:970-2463(-)
MEVNIALLPSSQCSGPHSFPSSGGFSPSHPGQGPACMLRGASRTGRQAVIACNLQNRCQRIPFGSIPKPASALPQSRSTKGRGRLPGNSLWAEEQQHELLRDLSLLSPRGPTALRACSTLRISDELFSNPTVLSRQEVVGEDLGKRPAEGVPRNLRLSGELSSSPSTSSRPDGAGEEAVLGQAEGVLRAVQERAEGRGEEASQGRAQTGNRAESRSAVSSTSSSSTRSSRGSLPSGREAGGERLSEEPPDQAVTSPDVRRIGAFQQMPSVSPSYELIGTALKRARKVAASKGIVSAAKRERSRGAQQLDTLTKELAAPLATYVKRFPAKERLHPFERELLELTLGVGKYEETLQRVDALRKRILHVGKDAASQVNKTATKTEAADKLAEGFARVETLFANNCHVVDALKEVAKTLRAMPVVNPRVPTLCLVGAPNVGKSSLVRALSSGKPEVCNYPFTTRAISMGHFFVDGRRFQRRSPTHRAFSIAQKTNETASRS